MHVGASVHAAEGGVTAEVTWSAGVNSEVTCARHVS